MRLIDGKCLHDGWHCSIVYDVQEYAVTKAVEHPEGGVKVPVFIRWSTPDDPGMRCLCACEPCVSWQKIRAEIDGPLVLPVE